jgi:hypothetical protein
LSAELVVDLLLFSNESDFLHDLFVFEADVGLQVADGSLVVVHEIAHLVELDQPRVPQ